MTVADDLIAARDLLRSKGRAVGKAQDDEGRLCLWLAIYKAVDFCPQRTRVASLALIPHMPVIMQEMARLPEARELIDNGNLLGEYNDWVAESDQDVFDLIDKTIANV